MMKRFQSFPFIPVVALWVVALASRASTDYYSAGFYTRGTEPAEEYGPSGQAGELFYVPAGELSFHPRLTLVASWEDNVFLDSQNEESARTLSLVPGIMAIYGRPGHNHLSADYGMSSLLEDSTGRLEENPSHYLSVGGVHDTGKTRSNLRLGYRRIENVDTLAAARVLKQDYIADGGIERRISDKSGLGGVASYEVHDFDDESYADYQRRYGGARVFHRLTMKSQVFVQAGYGEDDLDAEGDRGDSEFFDISLGLRGALTPKTSASGRVGYQWRDFADGQLDPAERWIAALSGQTNPFGFTEFGLELYSDIRPAINGEGSYAMDQRVVGTASRRLFTERLRGNFSIYGGRVDYVSPRERSDEFAPDDPLVYDGRRDEYWGFTAGVDWRTPYQVSFGLAYSYVENLGSRDAGEADQDLRSYESGRWTLRASWNY